MAHAELTPSGCIEWTASLNGVGYGHTLVRVDGLTYRLSHRARWAVAYGPIPEGMTVGHKCHDAAAERGECAGGQDCRHRRCLNLDHLALETLRDNIVASPVTEAGRHIRGQECPRGHRYDVVHRSQGRIYRDCRTCRRLAKQRRRAAA